MHRNASWMFNVVSELTADAIGAAWVVALHAEEASQPLVEAVRAGHHLVIKSHHGSAELYAWLVAAEARIILSVRDPCEMSVSMTQRFSAPLNDAVNLLNDDCNRLVRLVGQGICGCVTKIGF
jgi:hypothetical protein